jgi:adenosylcobinamide-GDP ribazoletransferase
MAKAFWNKLKVESNIVITAFMFFTRLPMPPIKNYNPVYLQKSSKYFSWVGLFVGFTACLPLYFLNDFFGWNITILLSMATTILVTGAFHEDGFADCCDAFGGGWNKEKILTIMKDSRLGTYGVIGLIGILSLKFAFLLALSQLVDINTFLLLVLLSHSFSRLAAVFMMHFLPYVQDIDASKAKPLANQKLSFLQMLIAFIAPIIPFLFLNLNYALIVLPIIPLFLYIKYYFNKWIGGYTGDCLGATQQIFELVIYFCSIIVAKLA